MSKQHHPYVCWKCSLSCNTVPDRGRWCGATSSLVFDAVELRYLGRGNCCRASVCRLVFDAGSLKNNADKCKQHWWHRFFLTSFTESCEGRGFSKHMTVNSVGSTNGLHHSMHYHCPIRRLFQEQHRYFLQMISCLSPWHVLAFQETEIAVSFQSWWMESCIKLNSHLFQTQMI